MSELIVHATDHSFESDVLQSELPVLLDFWAPWCGPCKALNPVLESLAKDFQGRVTIVKINVDENKEVPARFGVRGIPQLRVLKDGEQVADVGKLRTKPALSKVLSGLISGTDTNSVIENNLDDLAIRSDFLLNADLDRVRSVLHEKPDYASAVLEHGGTPISQALMARKQDRIDLFLEFEPDLSVSELAGLGMADELASRLNQNRALANTANSAGAPPLFLAVYNARLDCIDLLIEAGADLDWAPREGQRPYLVMAMSHPDPKLLDHLASRGMTVTDPIRDGNTALHMAARSGNLPIIECLLAHGANREIQNDAGQTPAALAREVLPESSNKQALLDRLSL